MTELDDVLALLAKATPGEWQRDWNNDTGPSDAFYVEWEEAGPAQVHGDNQKADADAIAATVNYLRANGPAIKAALENDRRYRWIRDKFRHDNARWKAVADWNHENVPADKFDAAIDAAQEVGRD